MAKTYQQRQAELIERLGDKRIHVLVADLLSRSLTVIENSDDADEHGDIIRELREVVGS